VQVQINSVKRVIISAKQHKLRPYLCENAQKQQFLTRFLGTKMPCGVGKLLALLAYGRLSEP